MHCDFRLSNTMDLFVATLLLILTIFPGIRLTLAASPALRGEDQIEVLLPIYMQNFSLWKLQLDPVEDPFWG